MLLKDEWRTTLSNLPWSKTRTSGSEFVKYYLTNSASVRVTEFGEAFKLVPEIWPIQSFSEDCAANPSFSAIFVATKTGDADSAQNWLDGFRKKNPDLPGMFQKICISFSMVLDTIFCVLVVSGVVCIRKTIVLLTKTTEQHRANKREKQIQKWLLPFPKCHLRKMAS